MTVICFVGKPRSGKTLGMTQRAYVNYLQGHKIYSNYTLNFPNTKMNVQEMLDITLSDVEQGNKTLCIQEADKIFDSRRSAKEENRLLSSLTGQSGKRNLDILYDTQFISRIDSGLRYVTEYVVSCNVVAVNQFGAPLAFQYQWEDMYSGRLNKFILPASVLQPFYKMYDSYEATRPLVSEKNAKRKSIKQETD